MRLRNHKTSGERFKILLTDEIQNEAVDAYPSPDVDFPDVFSGEFRSICHCCPNIIGIKGRIMINDLLGRKALGQTIKNG